MGSETYKHYKKLIEDTKFYLRTVKIMIEVAKTDEDDATRAAANIIEVMLKELFKLYETE